MDNNELGWTTGNIFFDIGLHGKEKKKFFFKKKENGRRRKRKEKKKYFSNNSIKEKSSSSNISISEITLTSDFSWECGLSKVERNEPDIDVANS